MAAPAVDIGVALAAWTPGQDALAADFWNCLDQNCLENMDDLENLRETAVAGNFFRNWKCHVFG